MDAFIGEIRPFAFNWAPQDWLLCNGQPVNQNQYMPLYSVIGTIYGSVQTGSFNLPNLMGHALIGSGQSTASGIIYQIPTKEGTEGVTLSQLEMPAHTHTFNGAVGGGTLRKDAPVDNTYYLTNYALKPTATTFTPAQGYVANPPSPPNMPLNLNSISVAGGTNGITASHENRQPFLGIAYYICTVGYYPVKP
ncbi:phage tail protein [Mucilaginibacter paludis]|uniref:Tail Collar domain protein n=1 Tax=Mucilaginibacter paludis DSM 18603 TaxID=714943 RepID=H1Y2C2_9SPHI|nr:tail fiber protein [Mucilaginibacter paludis]EHQ27902.1 Tail Collar domain protein [Mucilaginibacter paludis DSM 18603]